MNAPNAAATVVQPESGARSDPPAAAAATSPPSQTDAEAARARLESSRAAELEGYAPDHRALGGQLLANGVQQDLGNAAIHWMEANLGRGITPQEARHGYDFSRFNFGPGAQAHLDGFGNEMRKAGASQEQVDVLLQAYEKARHAQALQGAGEAREVERLDADDARKASSALRIEWGNEYETNLRLLRSYVAGLPAAERDEIEQERNAEGVLALNDPAMIQDLVARARGGGSRKAPAEELRELRAMMADSRSAYWRGPDAERNQARFRDLIRRAT